jgi:putative Holliday junction resolvase
VRYLAIDPGSVRIGLAISDGAGRLARPLDILKHISRAEDSERIAQIASEHQVSKILVGLATNSENHPTLQGRSAKRLAAAIRDASGIEVAMWDESYSSLDAQADLIEVKGTAADRYIDDLAAARMLQDYLDANQDENSNAKSS